MSFTIKDVIATAFALLDNCSEEELDYVVAVEQLSSLIVKMKFERILGNVEGVITKGTLTYSDTTGVKANTLTNFGDAVYVEFNSQPIDECPVSMLDLYYNSGVQRVAFWTDTTVRGTKYVQLSIPQTGTLKVWYEPDDSTLITKGASIDLQDSLKYCIATRLAAACIAYIKFKDPLKASRIPALALVLQIQAKEWKDIYLEHINKIGVDRPFSRIPFQAGVVGN